MSTQWRHLAGDTSVFAFDVSFRPDPDPDTPFDEDLAQSWGSFALWAGGRNLCAHLEQGEELEQCHWYLLPLLEWLASSWERLFHEERFPESAPATSAAEFFAFSAGRTIQDTDEDWKRFARWQDWLKAHSVRFAADGGLFPDFYLRRWGDHLEVSVGDAPLPGSQEDLEFIVGNAVFHAPIQKAAEAIHEVLTLATAHILAKRPESERLQALSAEVASLKNAPPTTVDQRARTRVRLLSGLREGPGLESLVGHLAKRFRMPSLAEGIVVSKAPAAVLLFGGFSPTISPKDVNELAALLEDNAQRVDDEGYSRLVKIIPQLGIEQESLLTIHPGQRGGEVGDRLHELLGTAEADPQPFDVQTIAIQYGIRIERKRLDDRLVRGLSVLAERQPPLIVLNEAYYRGQSAAVERFSIAHEFGHLLMDRRRAKEFAITSGPWTSLAVEQRANGFAAAMLMPVVLLKKIVARLDSPLHEEVVRTIARQLMVSVSSLLDRLLNVGLLPYDAHERLRVSFSKAEGAECP